MMEFETEFSQLLEWEGKLQSLSAREADLQRFLENAAQYLAERLIALAREQTPIDTGTLARGWTSDTHEEAEDGGGYGGSAKRYAQSTPVRRAGKAYEIDVFNPVLWAEFVENGHYTPNRASFVPGRYMLRIAEDLLVVSAENALQKRLERFLREALR